MKLLVTPKNKKQEKAVKDFLEERSIEFIPAREKDIVPEWQKQFVRKSVRKYKAHPDLLISEKEAWVIIEGNK